ncbi:MAG: hypothetical protein KatS3mg057_2859 [Herpetosiphonaceae bacterium]|nr:MAG: hypothetical protein KatS3mg057_2859 [Herpetosiphonaceae bacterium]
MPVTDRMLIGAIASNPGRYDGAGEARYCRDCETIYFASAKDPATEHGGHQFVLLPALNPDGSGRLAAIFQEFIKRWPAERQEQLETFARRKGWDLAMELHYGGGALTDEETEEWQQVVQGELQRLLAEARQLIGP